MNRYQPPSFHPILGMAAVAMTALTFVLAVGVPTSLAPSGPDASTRATTSITEVAIIPARIDVVGVRDTNIAERQNKPRG